MVYWKVFIFIFFTVQSKRAKYWQTDLRLSARIVIKTNISRKSIVHFMYLCKRRVTNNNLVFSINRHNNEMYHCACSTFHRIIYPLNYTISLFISVYSLFHVTYSPEAFHVFRRRTSIISSCKRNTNDNGVVYRFNIACQHNQCLITPGHVAF